MAFNHTHATILGFGMMAAIAAGVVAMLWSTPSDPKTPAPAQYTTRAELSSFLPPTASGTLCRDGWVSRSTGSGTCSHHGGEA